MREVSNKKVLVLGAGDRVNVNAINHDVTKLNKYIDVVWDLNELPWPWKDKQFIFIEARTVLEHLRIDLVESLNECWRILESGGCIFVKIPYWNHERTWEDPTHRRGYALGTFDYFDPDTERGTTYRFYTTKKWKILEKGYTSDSRSSIFAKMKKRG